MTLRRQGAMHAAEQQREPADPSYAWKREQNSWKLLEVGRNGAENARVEGFEHLALLGVVPLALHAHADGRREVRARPPLVERDISVLPGWGGVAPVGDG
jgi:hypothetical protein